MPDYALVKDGEVVEVGPEPDAWENPDGSTTSTPRGVDTDPKVLAKAGYLPVEDKEADRPDGTIQDGFDFKVQKSKVVRTPRYVELGEGEVADIAPEVAERAEREASAQRERSELEQRVAALESERGALIERVEALETLVNETGAVSVMKLIGTMQQDIQGLKRADG